MTERNAAEAASLVEEIDAWQYAVSWESDEVDDEVNPEYPSRCSAMLFLLATALSGWIRPLQQRVLSLFSEEQFSDGYVFTRLAVSRLSVVYVRSQRRNGCEIWQAFLTVARLGRLVPSPRSERLIEMAMQFARWSLQHRMGCAGYMPWSPSAAVVMQIAEVDTEDGRAIYDDVATDDDRDIGHTSGRFALSCLRSLIARASLSRQFTEEATAVLARTLEGIDEGRIGDGNRDRLRQALIIMEAPAVLVQGLHNRLGQNSPLMTLGVDLVSRIVAAVRRFD
jgi:hypothetical protein